MKIASFKIVPDLPDPLRSEGEEKRDAFLESARDAGLRPSPPSAFLRDAAAVFAISDFAARFALRSPKSLLDLADTGRLNRSNTGSECVTLLRAGLTGITAKDSLAAFLRDFRNREMTRIAWRDILGLADLFETMTDLTRLADTIIAESFSLLHQRGCTEFGIPSDRKGRPQSLVIIGLGKLGGEELNFSSDVDLLFTYPEDGKTRGGKGLNNDDYFSRLCRRLIRLLGNPTDEGIVFRVDTRLRPDGENGPIVMSFDNMEHYYQNFGREWERYAWIKARATAGDIPKGEALIRRLSPFVFRRYLDYSMFEALRDMKQKISLEVIRRNLDDDVKLGKGGIREIEFFGQAFQLIRGGVVPTLQARRILDVLCILANQGIISRDTLGILREAYIFFRMTEHRLQEFSDQQTHRLPREGLQRLRLAVSMGFSDWKSFEDRLSHLRESVHHHFRSLLQFGEVRRPASGGHDEPLFELESVWQGMPNPDQARAVLEKHGFKDPDQASTILEHLKADPATRALSHEGRKRLDRLMPMIMETAAATESPLTTLGRTCDLIRTIERRTNYLALLLEVPTALTHLMRLVNASPWIATFLKQHPVLLDELLDTRVLYQPAQKTALQSELKERVAPIGSDELEYLIETLCIFKQINMLRVAASDITGVLPLMKVSDHLTFIAEVILEEVLERSWLHLVEKHGKPHSRLGKKRCDRGFVMIAYGKLGGIELGYKSDLDLVFLHAGTDRKTSGRRPLDNPQFFARLGQRVIHTLTAPTRAGSIYEIDMRLRPSGVSGILVSHIEAFRDYQLNQAWTWEHQALIRARAIGGDPTLLHRFDGIRKEVLTRAREEMPLKEAVEKMRERVRKERLKPKPGWFDLKESRGAMVDIEFLVQYLVLLHANRHPQIVEWTDNVRLLQSLMEAEVLDENTACLLRKGFLTYRATIHRLNLQEKPTQVTSDRFVSLRNEVRRIWMQILGNENSGS